jgi:RNA polymerase sigma-70 factor, ECF subfamily
MASLRAPTGSSLNAPRNDERELKLLSLIAVQDRRALEELYLAYHRRLTRFLMRLAPRYDIAEEVINDTFFVVWKKASEFRGNSQVSTWIMGIAYRRALKSLRDYKPNADAIDFTRAQQDKLSDNSIAKGDESAWVMQALQQLPVEQRIAIELAYYVGHSCDEIATITQCPVSTIKARLFHARQKLKQLLPQLAGETPQ